MQFLHLFSQVNAVLYFPIAIRGAGHAYPSEATAATLVFVRVRVVQCFSFKCRFPVTFHDVRVCLLFFCVWSSCPFDIVTF